MATKKKKLDVTNRKSIQNMITYLESVKKKLPSNCQLLCDRLADIGIRTALVSTVGNNMADYVLFSKEVKIQGTDETVEIMFGKDIGKLFGDAEDAPQISPILMMEYGSGSNGLPFMIVDDLAVGQGTFPHQKHAFDPKGWFYTDKNGVKHHSYGEVPQRPMQHAYNMMQKQVDSVIRSIDWL